MQNVLTIREAVQRAKADGMPISEYTLRHWVRAGYLPVRKVGHKVLLYYPNLIRYLKCEDGEDNSPEPASVIPRLRRVEV